MFEKIISKNPGDEASPVGPPPSARGATPSPASKADNPAQVRSSGQRNVLLPDVEIKGKVRFQNDLIVDGKIEGEIVSDGSLTIGENARIKAEIKTSSVVVYGKVHGNITVSDRIELRKDAEVVGDIKAKVLTMEAGAIFVGSSTVGAPTSADSTPAPAQNTPPAADKKPAANKASRDQSDPKGGQGKFANVS